VARPALPCCRCCGEFLDPLALTDMCADCRRRKAPKLAAARSALPHSGLTRRLILRLKYHRRRRCAEALVELVTGWLADDAEDGGAAASALGLDEAAGLVPVPLHPRRRCWRSFNQAELLAAGLSSHLGLPVLPLLRRIRHTRPQVGLSPEERHRNVKGAFAAVPGAVRRGATYVLVDDVYTSGATLRECAAVLVREGAGRVTALTVARPLDRRLAGGDTMDESTPDS
jgi:ComF family protein